MNEFLLSEYMCNDSAMPMYGHSAPIVMQHAMHVSSHSSNTSLGLIACYEYTTAACTGCAHSTAAQCSESAGYYTDNSCATTGHSSSSSSSSQHEACAYVTRYDSYTGRSRQLAR
jgi:hypothetical protein